MDENEVAGVAGLEPATPGFGDQASSGKIKRLAAIAL
jgi:hypothetical protein